MYTVYIHIYVSLMVNTNIYKPTLEIGGPHPAMETDGRNPGFLHLKWVWLE